MKFLALSGCLCTCLCVRVFKRSRLAVQSQVQLQIVAAAAANAMLLASACFTEKLTVATLSLFFKTGVAVISYFCSLSGVTNEGGHLVTWIPELVLSFLIVRR